jgi:hypothetical protein
VIILQKHPRKIPDTTRTPCSSSSLRFAPLARNGPLPRSLRSPRRPRPLLPFPAPRHCSPPAPRRRFPHAMVPSPCSPSHSSPVLLLTAKTSPPQTWIFMSKKPSCFPLLISIAAISISSISIPVDFDLVVFGPRHRRLAEKRFLLISIPMRAAA